MSTAPAPARKGEWLESWDPENEQTWDKSLAWRTLWVTTFCLTLAFVAWFLPSAIIPKLNALGYEFSKSQLYWMAAMPGLAAGLLRILWMVMPPIECPTRVQRAIPSASSVSFTTSARYSIVCTGPLTTEIPCPGRSSVITRTCL